MLNHRLAHVELGLQRFSADSFFSQSPNLQNVLAPKLRIWTMLAYRGSCPTLSNAVVAIILNCSRPQVGWVAAVPRCNARMEYKKPLWNVSLVKGNPCDSVRHYPVGTPAFYPAIPFLVLFKTTLPAVIRAGFFNFSPKPFLKVWRQKLRQEFGGDSLWLHQLSQLIVCRAFGPARDARAISF